MSAEDRDHTDLLESLIAEILEAEVRGEPIDRNALIDQHPRHADSLRDFFATHDRMKSAADLEPPTLPPSSNALDDPTVPPRAADTEELTMSPYSTGDDPTIAPTDSATAEGAAVGDQVRYFGDYELLEEIARGGMGVVFKARQINLNRIVALKMILAGQFAGDEDVQRFYTEAEAAAQLDHPGIVPIFEIGEHQGQHYFSMGYVEGESLAHKVSEGPLPPHEAAELVKKICDAMAYAHECGVIHRDLKPANVLMDRNGQPKVTDFGLAKKMEADSNLTGTGQILGTPAYMPPEQASGKTDVGPLADIYSIGAILYCLLTGRPPFQAANPMDTLLQVLDKEPLPPRQLNPSIPLDLQTICLKCLSKEATGRYRSSSDISDELQRFLNGEPIQARPVGKIETAWRWCRRNPLVSSLIATAATFLILGSTVSLYFAIQAGEEAENARVAQDAAERNAADAIAQKQAVIDARNQQAANTASALASLAEARYREAQSLRTSQAVNRQGRALECIREAGGFREQIDEIVELHPAPPDELLDQQQRYIDLLPQLRSEAMRWLTESSLQKVRTIDLTSPTGTTISPSSNPREFWVPAIFALDREGKTIAFVRGLEVVLAESESGIEQWTYPLERGTRALGLRFSSSEKQLIFIQQTSESRYEHVRIDLTTGQRVGTPLFLLSGISPSSRLRFSGDGSRFLLLSPPSRFSDPRNPVSHFVFDTESGDEVVRFDDAGLLPLGLSANGESIYGYVVDAAKPYQINGGLDVKGVFRRTLEGTVQTWDQQNFGVAIDEQFWPAAPWVSPDEGLIAGWVNRGYPGMGHANYSIVLLNTVKDSKQQVTLSNDPQRFNGPGSFSDDGARLLVVTADGTFLIDAVTGSILLSEEREVRTGPDPRRSWESALSTIPTEAMAAGSGSMLVSFQHLPLIALVVPHKLVRRKFFCTWAKCVPGIGQVVAAL